MVRPPWPNWPVCGDRNTPPVASKLKTFLSRERNPYLRYWFVQAAHTLQRYQPDYRSFYWRKYYQAHHHHHRQALILTARKAVRLIFALLHKGQLARLEEASTD